MTVHVTDLDSLVKSGYRFLTALLTHWDCLQVLVTYGKAVNDAQDEIVFILSHASSKQVQLIHKKHL